MPDDEPAPSPRADSQREAEMAQLGLEPTELMTSEGEVVIIFVKLQTNEIGANEV